MAKVFKEEQRFHDRIAIGAILAIGVLILYAIFTPYFYGIRPFPYLNLGIFIIVTAAVLYLIGRVRMDFSISRKKIRIKVSPLTSKQLVIRRDEVEELQFFKINEAVISSGLTVRFGDQTKNFYMGDRAGVILRLKNGKNRVIFSDSLYLDKERITSELMTAGWKVSEANDVTAKMG